MARESCAAAPGEDWTSVLELVSALRAWQGQGEPGDDEQACVCAGEGD